MCGSEIPKKNQKGQQRQHLCIPMMPKHSDMLTFINKEKQVCASGFPAAPFQLTKATRWRVQISVS